ncbi:SRPBCC family protein [Nitratireductor sp.]|uniref:SRPBCC family protein n=1 Tax=Nitratireductor sp. TaxID=1872084 RepID=UPI00261BF327|nr:SRPBCC family protein [Nitratireductor sp.]MCV0379506.1 SRPBCC family protein [Nitratireductor sp.]
MIDKPAAPASPWETWPLDKEIVIARVVDGDRETVFQAWADPKQIVQWFGPEGFQIESHEVDIRANGVWRFDMIAPDGTRFSNRMAFLRIETPVLIELDHGRDVDNDPDRFRLLVTFDEQDNGKTVVTLRQMHPTPERRAAVIGFGAVEFGTQTLNKLADHVAGKAGAAAARG